MTSIRSYRRLLPLIAVVGLAACAGEEAPSAGGPSAGAESAAPPVAREPLTEADLMDLAPADLSLEIPWGRNRVARDPAPAQGPAWLESVDVSAGDGFARTLFTFSDVAFFPGYEIDIVEPGTAVPCGEAGEPLALSGERAITIRLKPANAHDAKGVRVPVRTRSLSPEQFTEGGLVCDLNDNVVWAAGLDSGDQVRVLELRNPKRLAVDIR